MLPPSRFLYFSVLLGGSISKVRQPSSYSVYIPQTQQFNGFFAKNPAFWENRLSAKPGDCLQHTKITVDVSEVVLEMQGPEQRVSQAAQHDVVILDPVMESL